MPNLIFRAVSFAYGGAANPVFDCLDLTLDTGWRAALVGANGRGKTTLLRLLAGELEPGAGSIERPLPCLLFTEQPVPVECSAWVLAKNQAGPYLAIEAEIERLLAVADEPSMARYGELENEYRDRGGYKIDALLERELTALGLTPAEWTRPVGALSGGQQTRARLAGLFAAKGYPLIDEPTNHLDMSGRAQLAEYLASKTGFLLVSHDRAFLDQAAEHIVALNPVTVEHQQTSFSAWRARFQTRLAAQRQHNLGLRKEIKRLDVAARARRDGAQAREAQKTAGGKRQLPSERGGDSGFIGARAARQMKRALSVERRAEEAACARRDTLVDMEKAYTLSLTEPPPAPSARAPLLRAVDLVVARNDQPLFEPVRFELNPGERLAILGPNGCGKSTLFSLIARGVAGEPDDAQVSHSGLLDVQSGLQLRLCAQQPRWTSGVLARHLEQAGDLGDETRFRQIMAALGVRGDVLDQPLETLSHGQLKKVELARSLMAPTHILLWDEPLNYMDVDTREQVQAAMLASQTAMVFVEHDAHFVEAVATATLQLNRPGQGEPCEEGTGNYSD